MSKNAMYSGTARGLLGSNCKAPRVLIYDRSRAFTYEGFASNKMVKLLAGRPKAYFKATLTQSGLEIGDEVASQSW